MIPLVIVLYFSAPMLVQSSPMAHQADSQHLNAEGGRWYLLNTLVH
jgi:hypothetical protein